MDRVAWLSDICQHHFIHAFVQNFCAHDSAW